jgi:hypothetical protein
MPSLPALLDRLRIERVVWIVDRLVVELPGRSRRAIRRELRDNLRAAAAEVGAAQAVQRLGSLRRLANGYLDAEVGDYGPQPRWARGLLCAVVVEAMVIAVALIQNHAFVDGVVALAPHVDGTYGWSALAPGMPSGEVTLFGGQARRFDMEFPFAILLYPAVAYVLGSRLWRSLPSWRRL